MKYISIITDNNYAPHTGALIFSISKSNPTLNCKYFILGYSFTLDTINKFQELSTAINREIKIIPIYPTSIPQLSVYRRYSFLIYVKLYLSYLLPQTVDWVLNLDVDTIVNGSLEYIFNYPNKEKYALLAAEDYDGCDEYKLMSGLDIKDNYYNAGVCYFNLTYWRIHHLSEECTNFINHNKHIASVLEQGALSYVCKDTAQALPIKYNVLAGYYFYKPKVQPKYKKELSSALKEPIIIHYAEPIKPWHRNCFHPLKKRYINSIKQTPWKNIHFKINANRKILHMINMYIQYLLHNLGIRKINSFYQKIN